MHGVTRHDPAWGAFLLHLFLKTDHPTGRNEDNQKGNRSMSGYFVPMSTLHVGKKLQHCIVITHKDLQLQASEHWQFTLALLADRNITVSSLMLVCPFCPP